MKKLFLLPLLLAASAALSQNVRYDAPATAAPNAVVIVCINPANGVRCTNLATTYDSAGNACPSNAQDTPAISGSPCQSGVDTSGRAGFWVPAGTYDYTVCVGSFCNGPYTVTPGGGAAGGSVTSVTGTAAQISVATGTTTPVLSIPAIFTFPGTVTNNLSIFGATTSAQLLGLISNETGTGLVMGNDTPTILTPTVASFTNATHNHTNAAGGGTLTDAALSAAVTIAKGGTGTGSTLTGLMRGSASAMTAAELSGDVTTSGSNAVTLAAKYKVWEGCNGKGLGDGFNAIPAQTYPQFTCVNDTGATVTISGIRCWTDNNGTSTLNLANNAAASFLTGAVTCNNTKASGGAAGTQSATPTLANGDAITFSFVADGTSKSTNWTVSGTY